MKDSFPSFNLMFLVVLVFGIFLLNSNQFVQAQPEVTPCCADDGLRTLEKKVNTLEKDIEKLEKILAEMVLLKDINDEYGNWNDNKDTFYYPKILEIRKLDKHDPRELQTLTSSYKQKINSLISNVQ